MVSTGLVQLEIRDVFKVFKVTGDQGEVIFEGCSHNEEIQRTRVHSFALPSEYFPKAGASLSYGKRKGENRGVFQECLKFGLSGLGCGTS